MQHLKIPLLQRLFLLQIRQAALLLGGCYLRVKTRPWQADGCNVRGVVDRLGQPQHGYVKPLGYSGQLTMHNLLVIFRAFYFNQFYSI